jgi:Uma2 family endonuclease
MSLGYTRAMRAVMLEVPEELVEDRRRKGLDARDEVWAGVLHMVPPPASTHQRFARRLFLLLERIAERRGAEVLWETGVFDPTVEELRDYRVADLVIVATDKVSRRGVEGAATLVVEILSPNDESHDKLPFYARVGVGEVWFVDPITRKIEIFVSRDGAPVSVEGSELGIQVETVNGTLRITDGSDIAEI